MMHSIQNRFLIPTLVLILLGFGVSTAVNYTISKHSLETGLENQLIMLSASTVKHLDSWINKITENILSWGAQRHFQIAVQDSYIGKAARSTATQAILLEKENAQFYEAIFIADKSGRVITSTVGEHDLTLNVSEEEYFKAAVSGRIYLSSPFRSHISGNSAFWVAVPIKERDNIVGIFYCLVDLEYFSNLYIYPVQIGKTGHAAMFDHTGIIVAHPDKSHIFSLDVTQEPFEKDLLIYDRGLTKYSLNGVERLAAYQKAERVEWRVVIAVNLEEIFAPVARLRDTNLLITLVSLVVVGIILFIIVNGLVTPINLAAKYIDRISGGDIPEPIKQKYTGEIQRIINNLNKLIANLTGTVEVAEKIAAGDISIEVTPLSDEDRLGKSLAKMVDTLKQILADIGSLTHSAIQGELSVRGDTACFEGKYSDIMKGINDTLDAVIQPLNVAAACMDTIARGDFPEEITDDYRGDFNDIKNSINMLISNLRGVVHVAEKVAGGDLSIKIDIRSEQDKLGKALELMVVNVKLIVADINDLTDAARDGKLSFRKDASQFGGEFAKIIHGVNNTLDAVVNPLNLTAGYIEQISKGIIPPIIKQDNYRGDYSAIIGNLNVLIENLEEFAVNVQTSAEKVAVGSEQLSTSADQVSLGSSQQAASIQQISSSIEQMSSTISQNADNSHQTASIAAKAYEDAESGGKAVSETINAMRHISEKIRVIEDISRETNMLALNAAIEAARAGSHGKGFAVVAAEVRKLAENSQRAAKTINELSLSSIHLAENTGSLLNAMVEGIRKTSELVQEISAASAEQVTGIDQINTAIQQLDQVIQHNAASAEQMASGSRDFTYQADRLLKIASYFTISEERLKERRQYFNHQNHQKPDKYSDEKSADQKKYSLQTTTDKKSKLSGVELHMQDNEENGFESY